MRKESLIANPLGIPPDSNRTGTALTSAGERNRIKDWVEKKVRRHMLRARNRKGFGWTRWSRSWLYETLKLFNRYRVRRSGPKVAPAG